MTGKTAAEAAILCGLARLETNPEVDDNFKPFDLLGIAFYATAYPNTIFNISATCEAKHQAIDQYRAQFEVEYMKQLLIFLNYKEQEWGQDKPYSHGEPLKVLQTMHLQVFPDAMRT